MMKVKGYRILVKPDEIEKVSKGGIVYAYTDERVERAALQTGRVAGVGNTAWQGEAFAAPWCKEGDRILFSKHSGRFVVDPTDDAEYLIMNDTDVLCVIEAKNG